MKNRITRKNNIREFKQKSNYYKFKLPEPLVHQYLLLCAREKADPDIVLRKILQIFVDNNLG